MTTKETFDFNLQLFAVPTPATVSASNSTISVGGSEASSETVQVPTTETIESASDGTVAGISFSSSETSVTGTDGTEYTRVDSNSTVWSYTTTVDSVVWSTDTYIFDGTAATGYDVATGTATTAADLNASTTVQADSTINGGTYTNGLVLDGIGTVTLVSGNQIKLGTSNDTLALTGISGALTLDPVNNSIKQTIGDATLNATVSTAVAITASETGVIVDLVSTGEVALNSIDENQTWALNKGDVLKYNDITYTANGDLLIGNDSGVVDILDTLGAGVAISGADASTKIGYDSATIVGAVTSLSGSVFGETITAVAAEDGVISVAGKNSASLASGGTATITSSTGIVSISSGVLTLAGTDATFGNEVLNFSESGAAVTVDSDNVSGISYTGTASIHGATKALTDVNLNVNNKATWDIAATSKDVTVGFANNGAASLSGDATVTFHSLSGGASTIAASTGKSSLTLQDGGHISANADGDITNVGGLAQNSNWSLDNQTTATIGSETFAFSDTGAVITADGTGNAAARITFSDTATLKSANNAELNTNGYLTINSGAAWSIVGSSNAAATIDSSANLNLDGTSATAVLTVSSSSVNAQFTDAIGDTLTARGGSSIIYSSLNGGAITVNSVAGGSSIVANSNVVALGSTSVQSWTFSGDDAATLMANSAGTAATLAAFSGVATLSGATVTPIKVGDDSWTLRGANANVVTLAADGSATVSGGTVTGSAAAELNLHGSSIVANNVTVNSADNDIDFLLAAEGNGIVGIDNIALSSRVTVSGDTLITAHSEDEDGTVYALYTSKGTSTLEFVDRDELVLTVASGNAYTVSGGNVDYVVNYGKGASLAAVSVGGAGVSLTAASGTSTATIYGASGDAVQSINGLSLNDTVRTSSADRVYELTYNIDSSLGASEEKVITINDTQITIDRGDLGLGASETGTLYVNYDGSGSIPNVTLSPVTTDNAATIRATRGIYNIGQSRTGEIDDDYGYIYINSSGQATIEGSSVTESREARETVASAAATVGAIHTIAPAYAAFYNVGEVDLVLPTSLEGATQLHYSSSASLVPEGTVTSASGINLIGNTTLTSGELSAVTLQSHIQNAPINVTYAESTNTSLHDVVIDAVGPTLVAVGVTMPSSSGYESIGAINHTVLGSNSNSTLMVGPYATGNNLLRAGAGNDYLYHEGDGKVTLDGGAGNDRIAPGNVEDVVIGGAGADTFYDSNDINDTGYAIQDYTVSDGDVILATKLSSVTSDSIPSFMNSLDVNGHAIAVAGGPAITIGTDTDSSVGTTAYISDINGSHIIPVAWANKDASTVNASVFGSSFGTERGVAILASNNEAEDLVIGSSGKDTIYAGPGDSVSAGEDNDYISLVSGSGAGAMVQLSAGVDTVMNWNKGYDIASGDNAIYYADASGVNFGYTGNSQLVASVSGAQLVFGDDTAGNARILIGDNPDDLQKVFVLRTDGIVADDSSVADRYYSPNRGNTLYFTSGVTDVGSLTIGGQTFDNAISLGSDKFHNINSIVVNSSGNSTIIGSSSADTITVNAPTDSATHYRKAVSLGGGNDILNSGGTDTATAGIDLYFGYGAEGNDTVNNFGYYNSNDAYGDSSDLLRIFNWDNNNGYVVGTSDRIEVYVNGSSRLSIARSADERDNAIQFQMGNDETTRNVAKIGVTSGTSSNSQNSFTYEENVDIYYGNIASNRDTLSYTGNDDVNTWLDNKNFDSKTYYGIGVLNASSVGSGASLTLAGSGSINNTIYGGGSQTSLWGGYGDDGNDLLVAGDGEDLFFFGKGNGDDTIVGAASGGTDGIFLYDVRLSDISAEASGFNNDGSVSIVLNDGSSLRVTNANGVQFALADGAVYSANTSRGAFDSVSAS